MKIINFIKKKEIVNKKHILVIHREKDSEKFLDNQLIIIVIRIYGRSQIFFGQLF